MAEKQTDVETQSAEHTSMESDLYLEDALLNLQKAFSRVSKATARRADESPESALAFISGDVDFSLSLRLKSEADSLSLQKSGDLELSLKGKIRTDIRSLALDDAEEALSDEDGEAERWSGAIKRSSRRRTTGLKKR